MNIPQHIVEAAGDDHGCAVAVEFKRTFKPADGVDYRWIIDHAKAQFDLHSDDFKDLDDKANSIVVYVGSGTGLLTAGSIAAISSGTLSLIVAVCLLPSLCFALAALALAVIARRPSSIVAPPGVDSAVRYAEYFGDRGEAAFIGQIFLAAEIVRRAAAKKAKQVYYASNWFAWAVGFLVIPFVVGIVTKLPAPH